MGGVPVYPGQQGAAGVPYIVPTVDTASTIAMMHPTLAGGQPSQAQPSRPTMSTSRQVSYASVQQAAAAPSPSVPGVTVSGSAQPANPGVKPAAHTNPNSTQNMLQFAEIRDGVIIMNDGSFRSVVMLKSINFDLMSQSEQEGVELAFQGFLNSLFFPVQIFIRSQKVDLRPYIERLNKMRGEHDNMLLAMLMEDYVNFMSDLAQQSNIMDKRFYVVVPYFPKVDVQRALTNSKNFITGIIDLFSTKEQHVVINEADLEKAKTELRNRVQAVLNGLMQCGVQGIPLDTQELIELLYDTYNPDTATRQQINDFGHLDADVVTKGEGNAPQPHLQRELS